jgi:3-hydroxyacyl-CoA dehydrogenase/enoyl-CoA hydratase/3-hydroxybutyryl-CoA epimerase
VRAYGAGIAYVSAKAGLRRGVKDVSLEAAQRGKAYSEKIEAKAVSRGQTTQEKSDALLARITPTADPADLAGVDFVIEAVFEDEALKHKVFQEIEDYRRNQRPPGSNTSTLPITGLATGVKRQEDFIGIHFFSLWTRCRWWRSSDGEKASDEALARCSTTHRPIKKTPIGVNDSRGFFHLAVIRTFVNEAMAMLWARASSPPASSRRAVRPVTRRRRCSCSTTEPGNCCRRSRSRRRPRPRPRARAMSSTRASWSSRR